ncbi:hypothetical protein HRK28_05500 [Rathayibacter sp. VKM Ac-2835]|uniref:hypothetical protein n=1 Tax=Rathayibacter sp. VKM Ac-2835 TaxID=2739043 RepID=UPI0015649A9B|nr:hypothetical protein [Rathayibacter sp. VKM Ac-2835]NRG40371.1 hypothetical protein [Rathayibacter sp. VKM Ac-2835]
MIPNLHRDARRALAAAERLRDRRSEWTDPDDDHDDEVDEQLSLSPEGRDFIKTMTRHALDHPDDHLGLLALMDQHLVAHGGKPITPKNLPADPGADH